MALASFSFWQIDLLAWPRIFLIVITVLSSSRGLIVDHVHARGPPGLGLARRICGRVDSIVYSSAMPIAMHHEFVDGVVGAVVAFSSPAAQRVSVLLGIIRYDSGLNTLSFVYHGR